MDMMKSANGDWNGWKITNPVGEIPLGKEKTTSSSFRITLKKKQ